MDHCIIQKSGTSVQRVVVFRKTHQLSCKFRKGFHARRGNFRLRRERKTINVPTILSLTLVSLTGLLKAERSMVRITDSFTSGMSFLNSVYTICNTKITYQCKIIIVPEEGWFGQPKYSTPTKKSFYVVSTSASIFL